MARKEKLPSGHRSHLLSGVYLYPSRHSLIGTEIRKGSSISSEVMSRSRINLYLRTVEPGSEVTLRSVKLKIPLLQEM